MDYTTLVADQTTDGSIKRWINWSLIDSDGILTEAQAWIYSRLRVREMKATANVTISLAASTATLPTRFLDPIRFQIPGYMSRIEMVPEDDFESMLAYDTDGVLPTGIPTIYQVYGETINFNTKSDAAYTARMLFYQRPLALSVSNETNWLTERYPSLVRYACLARASAHRKEWDEMDRMEQLALAEIAQAARESDNMMRGMSMDFHWRDN